MSDNNNALAERTTRGELTQYTGAAPVIQFMDALKTIRTFVRGELMLGTDYGTIPGCGPKPALLKPGADKVIGFLRCCPRPRLNSVEMGNGHVEHVVTMDLVNIDSGHVVGSGLGSCSTMETKYRFRQGQRVCPTCGKEAIIKGKAEFGGGWLCWPKKDGCGAKFGDDDQLIIEQAVGQVENPNIWDQRNTVLKIGKKRALVDAALSIGFLSELFTQDIDDVFDLGAENAKAPEPTHKSTPPKPSKPAATPPTPKPPPEIPAHIQQLVQARQALFDTLGPTRTVEASKALWAEMLASQGMTSSADLTEGETLALVAAIRGRLAAGPPSNGGEKQPRKVTKKTLATIRGQQLRLGWDDAGLLQFVGAETDGRAMQLADLTEEEGHKISQLLMQEWEARAAEEREAMAGAGTEAS